MENIRFLNLEYLFLLAYSFFTGTASSDVPQSALELFRILQWIGLVAVLLLALFIAYAMRGIHRIERKHVRGYEEARSTVPASSSQNVENAAITKNKERFESVMKHAASANQNDWRFAILEADIMLGDMLVARGYQGESVGEMLKGVARGDMPSLDLAWEAHRIRNDVAHGGVEFHLSQREARRTVDLYGQVFKEAEYI